MTVTHNYGTEYSVYRSKQNIYFKYIIMYDISIDNKHNNGFDVKQ